MTLLLAEALVLAWLGALAATALLRQAAGTRIAPAARDEWVTRRLAQAGIVVFLAAMAARSLDFGVDTAVYAGFFAEHCQYGPHRGIELSYSLSAAWLDAGMLGACSVPLLPATWAGLIVLALLLVQPALADATERARLRLRLAALLLFSMVGIELATNALRQGLSAATLLLAVSLWPRRAWLALPLAALAAGFHSSAVLVIGALVLARLGWPAFLATYGLLLALVWRAMHARVEPPWLEPLLFELQKYLAHADDELWVRVLSAAALFGTLLAAAWAASPAQRRSLRREAAHGMAWRLAFTCLPLLAVPYFGYRYVYGLYPVVLLFVLLAAARCGVDPARLFWRIAAVNSAVLAAWSLGSVSMLEVPFLG